MASEQETQQQTVSGVKQSIPFESINELLERRWLRNVISVVLLLVIWQIASLFTSPTFLASPIRTVFGILELVRDGTLQNYVAITTARILAGWSIGSTLAIAVGWTLGYSTVLRRIFEPYINFFRGLPPIIWISLVVIWFGYGPLSRISLVAYGVFAVVILDSIDSVMNVETERVRAARSLGASPWEAHLHVRIPSSIPEVFTAIRVGLGIGAMSIVAIEMLISSSGIGYLVWIARTYLKPEWVFAGVITLGTITWIMNYLLQKAGVYFLGRYGVRG